MSNIKQAKTLIEENIGLIDHNKFMEFYEVILEQSPDFFPIGEVTKLLYSAGIDPLESINEIPAGFFAGQTDIVSFEIPRHIKKIGMCAFQDTSIEEINIPEGVKEIEEGAFNWNPQLKKITLPVSLKVLGNDVFEGCENLHEIYYAGTFKDWHNIYTFNARIVNSYKNNTLHKIICSDKEVNII